LFRRRRAGQFWSVAAARHRSQKIGGGASPAKIFSKDFLKNFVLSSKFSDDLFNHRKSTNQAPINKSRRCGAHKLSAAAARPAHCSTCNSSPFHI